MDEQEYERAERLGKLYEELHDLLTMGTDRPAYRRDLDRLVVRYGEENVRFMLGVLVEDLQNG